MSQRVSEKGFRRKTSVSGRPTPLFLLSHGSSVPSGVHTITETPNQQCAQEGDNFSATAGKGGTVQTENRQFQANYMCECLLDQPKRQFGQHGALCLTNYSKNLGPTDVGSTMFFHMLL